MAVPAAANGLGRRSQTFWGEWAATGSDRCPTGSVEQRVHRAEADRLGFARPAFDAVVVGDDEGVAG
jgi:hypothetical protein